MFQSLADVLPPLYSRLFPDLTATAAPIESEATCSNCAMCSDDADASAGRTYFSPHVKCCTYHPSLPNFLVGALLADERSEFDEGRRRVRAKIEHRVGVTPHGIVERKQDAVVYDAVTPQLFGRAEALRCPYYETAKGNCTIWQFRESVCSTFYCKFVHGGAGSDYWRMLQRVLHDRQLDLVHYALHRLGFDAHAVLAPAAHEPSAEELDGGRTPDARHRALFRGWFGREEALYLECYRVVSALTADQAVALGGVRATLQAAALDARRGAIESPVLSNPLLRNPHLEQRRDADGAVMLVSFSNLQPIRLRAEVLALLDHFDGRTATHDVLQAIESVHGYRITDALLTRLYQFRILVAANSD